MHENIKTVKEVIHSFDLFPYLRDRYSQSCDEFFNMLTF